MLHLPAPDLALRTTRFAPLTAVTSVLRYPSCSQPSSSSQVTPVKSKASTLTISLVRGITNLREGKMADVEKQEQVNIHTVHQLSDKDGYILDATKVDPGQGLKLSQDRQTVLIPQPSGDPQDPLNWSQGKKNLILFIVSATALLADYGSATGAVTLVPQATYVFQHVHLCTQNIPSLTRKNDQSVAHERRQCQPLPGRQPIHARRGGCDCSCAGSVFRSTASLLLVRSPRVRYGRMVRGRLEF